jgi:carboxymethylenebutenolidase
MGTTVQLTTVDGNTLNAYKSEPEGSPKGAVIVVQEIFGVNDHIRSVADGYAREGYVAIAPALFDRVREGIELGYDQDGIDIGRKIAFEDVTMDQVIADVEAACDAVSPAGKVGIVGYCWGGSICYVAAARLSNKISAASGYYGGQIVPHLDEKPRVPVMLHFGSEDAGIPLESVRTIAERWPEIDVHVYEGAGHGFNCDARGSYEADSAAVALERTLKHFAACLG